MTKYEKRVIESTHRAAPIVRGLRRKAGIIDEPILDDEQICSLEELANVWEKLMGNNEHRVNSLNNDIQTCYRYLEFIEETLDRYENEVGFVYHNFHNNNVYQLRQCLNEMVDEVNNDTK